MCVSMFVCVYMCMWVFIHICTHVCRGQRSILAIFLSHYWLSVLELQTHTTMPGFYMDAKDLALVQADLEFTCNPICPQSGPFCTSAS